MIPILRRFFEQLNDEAISYCHWKSNWVLDETVSGGTDIDILIRRAHAPRFRSILDGLGFRPAIEANVDPFPSVEHYHALDPDTAKLVHVHAYYRVISGESLAKNHRLPFEDMLLSDTRKLGIVSVPSVPAEIISFVVRMCLKHTSAVELAFAVRDWPKIRAEADWLFTDADIAQAIADVTGGSRGSRRSCCAPASTPSAPTPGSPPGCGSAAACSGT